MNFLVNARLKAKSRPLNLTRGIPCMSLACSRTDLATHLDVARNWKTACHSKEMLLVSRYCLICSHCNPSSLESNSPSSSSLPKKYIKNMFLSLAERRLTVVFSAWELEHHCWHPHILGAECRMAKWILWPCHRGLVPTEAVDSCMSLLLMSRSRLQCPHSVRKAQQTPKPTWIGVMAAMIFWGMRT